VNIDGGIIWIGVNSMTATAIKVCADVLYCPPVNSELFSVNFLRGLNEEINMLIFLIVGDFDCRTGERQMEVLHFLDA
jgi:hypothetical protein